MAVFEMPTVHAAMPNVVGRGIQPALLTLCILIQPPLLPTLPTGPSHLYSLTPTALRL